MTDLSTAQQLRELADRGRGVPRAVELQGDRAVEAWAREQYEAIELEALPPDPPEERPVEVQGGVHGDGTTGKGHPAFEQAEAERQAQLDARRELEDQDRAGGVVEVLERRSVDRTPDEIHAVQLDRIESVVTALSSQVAALAVQVEALVEALGAVEVDEPAPPTP